MKRVGVLVVLACVLALQGTAMVVAPAQGVMLWSNPASWPSLGRVPISSDIVTIPAGQTIYLDTMTAVARKLIVYGTLTKLPGTNVQLTMSGNLIVDQAGFVDFSLTDGSTWFVQFIVPNENQFVGGGLAPVDSDIGWWVIGAGRVNLQGSQKTAWTRLASSATAGQTQITVLDATGWRVGDEIAVVPSEPPTTANFHDHYDVRTISAVSGTTVTLSAALSFGHPAVTVRPGVTHRAEVLNLTRTGRIEGRAGLRTHFWIRNTSAQVQTLRYVQFRHLGPQRFQGQGSQANLVGVLGRWGGPHFHMNGTFSNGSLVEGCVVRNFGNHAYVPHDSNGITFNRNIAHDGHNDAFWYDTGSQDVGPSNTVYDGNVASRVQFIPVFRGYRLTGFFLGAGSGNTARNNVAVGVQGNSSASGFHWPESSHGVWTFDTGNLAHNNKVNGIFTWQNDSLPHTVLNFTAYYNGKAGIEHGAYHNDYLYQDITLYGNQVAAMILLATPRSLPPNPGLRLVRVYFDAFGQQYALMTGHHNLPARQPVHIVSGTFLNYTKAGIGLLAPSTSSPESIDVTLTTFSGNKYWLLSTIPAASLLVDYDEGLYVRRAGQPGTPMPQWNASTTPFARQR
ncbi:MAG: hypothetical protein ACT4P5_10875 [Armatimonadota bacterium]